MLFLMFTLSLVANSLFMKLTSLNHVFEEKSTFTIQITSKYISTLITFLSIIK